jgi:hypothetical protein
MVEVEGRFYVERWCDQTGTVRLFLLDGEI